MPKSTVNTDGANKKIDRLQREFPRLMNFLLDDAAEFFRDRLVDEQLAGAPGTIFTASAGARVVVGRQSGNLARSYTQIVRQGLSRIITSSAGIAPYALAVARNVLTQQGRDYLRVTKFYYEGPILKKATKAVTEWLRAVDRGQPWNYRNPYA